VVCASGARASLAALTLKTMGYQNVAVVDGGLKGWIKRRPAHHRARILRDLTSVEPAADAETGPTGLSVIGCDETPNFRYNRIRKLPSSRPPRPQRQNAHNRGRSSPQCPTPLMARSMSHGCARRAWLQCPSSRAAEAATSPSGRSRPATRPTLRKPPEAYCPTSSALGIRPHLADRTRDWIHNITADPQLVVHLKQSVAVDIPAAARVVTDPAERRPLMAVAAQRWGRTDVDDMVDHSPLIVLTVADVDERAKVRPL